MKREQLKQITEETFNFLNNKGVSFICFIWDDKGRFGGGCQSANVDTADALVAIEQIIKHFDINPVALYQTIIETKAEMDRG